MTEKKNPLMNLVYSADIPLATVSVKLKKGKEKIQAGTVLAVGTDGYAVAVDSAKSGQGQDKPYAILAFDSEERDADVFATAYSSGMFNGGVLTFGGSDNLEKHKEAMRALGMFVKEMV